MIDFEEELAKFKPSLEIDQADDAALSDKMTDMTDIMLELMEEMKRNTR
ncbi:MAG: hypothetical protein ACLRZ7_10195 [Lachnospiraceae bacterium]